MQLEGPVLVVAAHPDDEVLGAGGLIARNGLERVDVCVLTEAHTKGRPDLDRQQASRKAAENIELDWVVKYRWCGFEDERLELNEAITAIEQSIDLSGASTVVVPYIGDMNQDHRTTAEAALIATRMSRRGHIRNVLMMEIPSSTGVGLTYAPFEPSVYVQIDWSVKQKMLEAYEHELTYNDRHVETCEALAKVRGAAIGVPYAEGFVPLRMAFRTE